MFVYRRRGGDYLIIRDVCNSNSVVPGLNEIRNIATLMDPNVHVVCLGESHDLHVTSPCSLSSHAFEVCLVGQVDFVLRRWSEVVGG